MRSFKNLNKMIELIWMSINELTEKQHENLNEELYLKAVLYV